MKIQLLNDKTIQKIAAGEVIERPFSIVKELVENSIDAGAKNISVSIKNGGIDEIIVSDDGCGIDENELETAFLRHATSKIVDFDDLYKIYTMGFRGEALASIKAAADIEIKSRTKNSDFGTKLILKNSNIIEKEPIAMNVGTNITVENLFSTIPVRKKFLKSERQEAIYINDLMCKLAVGNLNISFKYYNNGKLEFSTNRLDSYLNNITNIFGNKIRKSLVEINLSKDDYKLTGYISDNTYYRGNRQLEYVFVNNRAVQINEIRDEIEKSFRQIIPQGKFPAYQLFLEINPSKLDVNIHPNKQKISLQGLDEITKDLAYYIKNHLLSRLCNTASISSVNEEKSFYDESYDKYEDLLNKFNPISQIDKVKEETNHFDTENTKETEIQEKSIEIIDFENLRIITNNNEDEDTEDYLDLQLINNSYEKSNEFEINENKRKNLETINEILDENFIFIFDMFNKYLVYQSKDKILIINKFRAHERVNYENLKIIFSSKKYESQLLLTPIVVDFFGYDNEFLEKNKDLLQKYGFEYDMFSKNSIAIRQIPSIMEAKDAKNLFVEIMSTNYTTTPEFIDNLIKKIASIKSVNSKDSISRQEAETLLKELFKTGNPITSPRGKIITSIITKDNIEKELFNE